MRPSLRLDCDHNRLQFCVLAAVRSHCFPFTLPVHRALSTVVVLAAAAGAASGPPGAIPAPLMSSGPSMIVKRVDATVDILAGVLWC